MVDKAETRKALDQLLMRLDGLARDRGLDQAWQLKRDLVLAEIDQWAALTLPPDSQVLGMLRKRREAPVDSAQPSEASGFEEARAVIEAAQRWNEARRESDATSGLADDIERVLSKNVYGSTIVRICIGTLVLAVGFAVAGTISVYNMSINLTDVIAKKRDELDEQVVRMNGDLKSLKTEIDSSKQKVAALVMESASDFARQKAADIEVAATSAIGAVNEKRNQALSRVESAGDVAPVLNAKERALSEIHRAADVNAVSAAQEKGIADVRAAADTRPVQNELTIAAATVKAAALKAVEEAKARVAPQFNTEIENERERVQKLSTAIGNLEDRISESDSDLTAIKSTFDGLKKEDHQFAWTLASALNTTVAIVYGAAVVSIVILFGQVWWLVNRLWKAWSARRRPA